MPGRAAVNDENDGGNGDGGGGGGGEQPQQTLHFEKMFERALKEHRDGSLCGPEQRGDDATGDTGAGAADTFDAEHTGQIFHNVLLEEQRATEHMKKLKFHYLELNTKRQFLQSVSAAPQGAAASACCPSEERVAEIELEAAHAKEELKRVKARSEEARERVAAVARDVAGAHEEYIREFERCRAKVEDLNARVAERRARDSLAAQEDSLRQLRAEEQRLQDEAAGLEWELRPLESNAREMRQDVDNLEATLSESKEKGGAEGDAARVRMMRMDEWYKSVVKSVEALTGVSVQQYALDSMVLEMRRGRTGDAQQQPPYRVRVGFEPDSVRVRTIEVEGAPLEPGELDALAAHANRTNDLGWLVREVRQRLLERDG